MYRMDADARRCLAPFIAHVAPASVFVGDTGVIAVGLTSEKRLTEHLQRASRESMAVRNEGRLKGTIRDTVFGMVVQPRDISEKGHLMPGVGRNADVAIYF